MTGILPGASWRSLLPGQVSEVCAMQVDTGAVEVLHRSADRVLEAPNWTPDGRWVIVNSAGGLFRFPAVGGPLEAIPTGDLDDHNNDHVVSRDGRSIFTSSEVSGHLYAVPLDGGEPRRLTRDQDRPFGAFLQGVSPDGAMLAFTGADARPGRPFANDLYTLPAAGGVETRLTERDTDSVGCDWSPDGARLYYNGAQDALVEGHMHLYRMRPDGSDVERLTDGDGSDWFPRISPDGRWVVFVRFPPGTIGHTANTPVALMRMRPDGSELTALARFTGGQGTLNVPSWAPDGLRFAFVRYPLPEEDANGSR